MTAPNLEYPPRLAYIIFSLIRIDGSNKNVFIIIMWTKRDKTKPVLVLVDSELLLQYHKRAKGNVMKQIRRQNS